MTTAHLSQRTVLVCVWKCLLDDSIPSIVEHFIIIYIGYYVYVCVRTSLVKAIMLRIDITEREAERGPFIHSQWYDSSTECYRLHCYFPSVYHYYSILPIAVGDIVDTVCIILYCADAAQERKQKNEKVLPVALFLSFSLKREQKSNNFSSSLKDSFFFLLLFSISTVIVQKMK